jgi:hypothetical protein
MTSVHLFSDDGIDAGHAKFEPACLYYPDESTCDDIKYLFTTLESTQRYKESDGQMLEIQSLPFSADLSSFSQDENGEVLSLNDVRFSLYVAAR